MTYLPLRFLRGVLREIAQKIEIQGEQGEKLGILIHRLKISDYPLFAVLPDGNKINIKFANLPSVIVLTDIYDDEIYERKYCIKRGDVVIDIGANIGIFTLKSAKLVGSEGRVVAIEPDPLNFQALLRNLRINALKGKVVAINEALGNVDGKTKFFIDRYYPAVSSTHIKQEHSLTIEVKMSKLVSLVTSLGTTRVDFIKCDAEGAEVDIINGAFEVLKYIMHMAIAAYHIPSEKRLVLANTLKCYGFRVTLNNGYLYADREL
jgi:FkbM family methyltransferase